MNSGITEEQVTQIIDLILFDEPKKYDIVTLREHERIVNEARSFANLAYDRQTTSVQILLEQAEMCKKFTDTFGEYIKKKVKGA